MIVLKKNHYTQLRQIARYALLLLCLNLLQDSNHTYAGAPGSIDQQTYEPVFKPTETPAKTPSSMLESKQRGQMLYENHCRTCHESAIHIRENRRAKTAQDIQHWVARWANELKLNWTLQEIDDVTQYVKQRYYKLDD